MGRFTPKHDPDKVLHSPFDFGTHNETFVNYCEVIIDRDGTIRYGVPSHIEALKRMYREEFSSDPDEDCPPEYYCDYMWWLCDKLEACVVYTKMFTKPYNDKQRKRLRQLQMHGCCKFDKLP